MEIELKWACLDLLPEEISEQFRPRLVSARDLRQHHEYIDLDKFFSRSRRLRHGEYR
jgi:hypothetical protein